MGLMKEEIPRKPNYVDLNEIPESVGKDPTYRARWTSIIIVYFLIFLSVIQGSLYWSSLWPFFSQIDSKADESFLGYIILSYNIGSVIASPLLGWLANRLEQTKIPILIGIICITIGNILFAFVQSIDANRRWLLLMARFITGLGTGNLAPLTAYIIMATTDKERNRAIATRTTVSSLALILGPATQAVFVPIGYPGYVLGKLHFDMYTAAAFVGTFLGIFQLIFVSVFFKEIWVSVKSTEMRNGKKSDAEPSLKPYDKRAVTACVLTRFFALFVYSYDNTIGSPFTMAMFGWSKASAVLYNGIIQVCGGVESVIGSILIGSVILKRLRERCVVIFGILSLMSFFVFSFSWPGLPPLVFTNGTSEHPPKPLLGTGSPANETAINGTGCDYIWCQSTTRIYLFQYIIGFFFMIGGYVTVQTANGILFSKVIGPRKQGSMSGIYQASGKIGMAVSPLVNTHLFQFYGPRVAWGFGFLMLAMNLTILLVTYKRLVEWVPDDDGKTVHPSYDTFVNEPEESQLKKNDDSVR